MNTNILPIHISNTMSTKINESYEADSLKTPLLSLISCGVKLFQYNICYWFYGIYCLQLSRKTKIIKHPAKSGKSLLHHYF